MRGCTLDFRLYSNQKKDPVWKIKPECGAYMEYYHIYTISLERCHFHTLNVWCFVFFTLAMCIVVCVLASQPLCQRRVPITSSCVSNTRKWPIHHFVTLLPLLLCLLTLSFTSLLPLLPSASTNWNSERYFEMLKVKLRLFRGETLRRSSTGSSLKLTSEPLIPPQKWKETLKYFKSSLWIRPTEVGVSCKAFNPSSSEIIKHHCSEEPVGFFKTSSCRPLFPQPIFFSLSAPASLLSAFSPISSTSTSFSLLPLNLSFNLVLKCTLGLKKKVSKCFKSKYVIKPWIHLRTIFMSKPHAAELHLWILLDSAVWHL